MSLEFLNKSNIISSVFCPLYLGILVPGTAIAQFDNHQQVTKPCPQLEITAMDEIDFTQAEITLICGKRDQEAWQDISLRQSEYFVRIFLQDRGYHQPVSRRDGETLHVHAGPLSVINSIELQGSPVAIETTRLWEVHGRPLTPDALDQIEQWLRAELAKNAFPCVSMELSADPNANKVIVQFQPAQAQLFPHVEPAILPNMLAGLERRYYAFKPGEPFDSRKLAISQRRIIADDVAVSATFRQRCVEGEPIHVSQRIYPGDPRVVSFGIGVDTEEYLISEAGWRSSRIGLTASSLAATIRASYRTQAADLTHRWYYAPVVTRHYLRSTIQVRRDHEKAYTSHTIETRAGPAWQWDDKANNYELWTGVSHTNVTIVEGPGPKSSHALSLESELNLTAHEFEHGMAAPNSGYRFGLRTKTFRRDFNASYSADEISLDGTYLYNLFGFDPSLWIFGLRGKLASILLPSDTEPEDVPTASRLRLGGRDDLRGFGRQSLPIDGALTTLYLGSEMRIDSVFPYRLQPLVLLDYGRYGAADFTLSPTSFWSIGTGVNWHSPFGDFRTTLAYGYVSGKDQDELSHLQRWVLHFSFGEQF